MSDDVIENVRLWLADPLAVNWANRATVRDLMDEIDRLRAERDDLGRYIARRYEQSVERCSWSACTSRPVRTATRYDRQGTGVICGGGHDDLS